MGDGHFSSYRGGRHHTAVIGQDPESAEYTPGQKRYYPAVSELARVEAFVTVDSGLRRPTHIGHRAWLMKHVHVGHDAFVGDDCQLAPGTIVGGHAELAEGVRCGIGALVLPFRKVGAKARIGAGAVVTHNVPAGEVWAGNPARKMPPGSPVPFDLR